jgi:hypothetical protein
MMIGKFNQQGDVYTGSIYGLGFNVPYVVFSPIPAKQGNSSPDFVVLGALSEKTAESSRSARHGKRPARRARRTCR